ncbi:MAG: Hsp70 family protein, partial [Phycisphaera sp.]|nr:Hsp70 family protein [Phycisphaera sp.]
KELRKSAEERFGTAPMAAVITVPAMFEMPQRDATAQAAKLAGFEHSVLLQEPVAAAAAFGFQTDSDKAYWLVYDYGGGTFDASIVSVRDGQLTVVKHGGDNYLGGADFDRTIVDEFLVPAVRDEHDLDDLDRSNIASCPKTRARFAMLKVQAEKAKVNLSRGAEEEVYEDSIFEDNSGDPVDLECTITRAEFDAAILKYVEKSIAITKELIAECDLKPGDIEKVLLVGGSTFVPLVQSQVESLGIPVDRSMDPMTVVAHGAAVFAGSQRMPKDMRAAEPVKAGAARVELEYEPTGKDLEPPVVGKVSVDGGQPPAGTTVELKRTDDGFTSGQIALVGKGIFTTEVSLRENGKSEFSIEVRDAGGTPLESTPAKFSMQYGMSVAKATLPSGIQVGLADGSVKMILSAGTTLPATSGVVEWISDRWIRKGSSDELRIPILSGDE